MKKMLRKRSDKSNMPSRVPSLQFSNVASRNVDPQGLNFVDPVHHLFFLPLPGLKQLTCIKVQGQFLYVNFLRKLFMFRPIAVLGSPLMRVSTNLYKMVSWLGLITANAVSTFPTKARTSCLFPLNGGTKFNASPILITCPFTLEVSLLTALRELELGESMGRNQLGKDLPQPVRCTRASSPAGVRLKPVDGPLSNPELAVSSLSRTLDRRCRFTLEP